MPNAKPAILIATTLGIATGIVLSVRPWVAYGEQREEARSVVQDLKIVRAQRARLEREEAKTRSEVGRETKAREQGFRAKGERDLTPPPVVERPANPPKSTGSDASDSGPVTETPATNPPASEDATNGALRDRATDSDPLRDQPPAVDTH